MTKGNGESTADIYMEEMAESIAERVFEKIRQQIGEKVDRYMAEALKKPFPSSYQRYGSEATGS